MRENSASSLDNWGMDVMTFLSYEYPCKLRLIVDVLLKPPPTPKPLNGDCVTSTHSQHRMPWGNGCWCPDFYTSSDGIHICISIFLPLPATGKLKFLWFLSVCFSLLKIAMYFLNWDSCYRIVSFVCNTLDKDQSCFHVFNFYSQGLTCSQTGTAICFTQTPHLSLSVPGSDRAGSALLCWVFRKAWGACFCPWLFSRSTPQRLGVKLASSDPGVWLYSSIHFLATRSANGEGLVQVRLFWALGVKKKSRTPTSRSPSLCQRSQTTFEAMMVHGCLHLKAVRRKD